MRMNNISGSVNCIVRDVTKVYHVDNQFDKTNRKLSWEQRQSMERIKYFIRVNDDNNLEKAIDECKFYTELMKMRQANIEQQASIAQLDLFY